MIAAKFELYYTKKKFVPINQIKVLRAFKETNFPLFKDSGVDI